MQIRCTRALGVACGLALSSFACAQPDAGQNTDGGAKSDTRQRPEQVRQREGAGESRAERLKGFDHADPGDYSRRGFSAFIVPA